MTEQVPSAVAPPSLRTWRPMAAWTTGILLALGLAWFVGAVVVPEWKTRAVVETVYAKLAPRYMYNSYGSERASERQAAVQKLGGPELAAQRLGLYLTLPEWVDSEPLKSGPICDYGPRGEAFEILSLCGKSSLPPLMRSLSDSRSCWRSEAARALGRVGSPANSASPALARALGDSEPAVRRSVALALGEIGNPSSARPLMVALEDQDDEVREMAVHSLGKIDASGSRAVLIRMLADESIVVQCEAAASLGRLGERKALPALAAALTDHEKSTRLDAWAKAHNRIEEASYVRRKAAEALGLIGDMEAITPLTEGLKDENQSVRTAAADALKKIRGEEPPK